MRVSSGMAKSARSGPLYLPAYAAGVRAGLPSSRRISSAADPREVGVVYRLMDER